MVIKLSKAREFWILYVENRMAVIGLVIIIFFLLMAVFAPLISPTDPYSLGTEAFVPPCWKFPLGTDDLGRNVLSQIIYGSRVSMAVGFTSSVVATIIGIVVGSIAGYFGGVIDRVLTEVISFFMAIPRMPLAIVLVALIGPGLVNLVFVLVLITWTTCARITRSVFFSLKEKEFVMATKGLGVSSVKIIFGEILPNALSPIIVNMTVQVGIAILLESSLSFLGLGDPNIMSWGYIIKNGYRWFRFAWWPVAFSGMSIFLAILGFNLLGDGLNDVLNVRLRGTRR